MPDRTLFRHTRPTWLPLAAGGAVLAALLALIGGYFVWQDQQDRAARAAHADCVAAWKGVVLSRALVDIERTTKRDELRRANVGDEESYQQADDYAKASEAAKEREKFLDQASRLAARWDDRWSRLGLPIPGP